jgi:hypothetical protein
MQNNTLESADPHGDDEDDFVDIDDVLSGIQQRSMLASASLNSGGMAVLVDNGTRGGSPTDSSCSTAGSNQGERLGSQICPGPLTHTTSDPIILSDDDCASAESETDCSDLDVDARSKSDSNPPHAADSELADGGSFSSEPPSFLIVLSPTINTTITITTAEPTKPSFASQLTVHDQPPLTWDSTHTKPVNYR